MSEHWLFVWGVVVVCVALMGFWSDIQGSAGQGGDEARSFSLMRMGSKRLLFLAAFVSFVLSVSLFFLGSREQGIFVGIWVPSILSAGNLLHAGRR